VRNDGQRSSYNPRVEVLEDLGDVDIALGPHLEEKTCEHLQDLLVLQGTTKSTRKKSQEILRLRVHGIRFLGIVKESMPSMNIRITAVFRDTKGKFKSRERCAPFDFIKYHKRTQITV